ncbi:hypothetical protein DIPPA_00172 [Diplonema papillatum]|nr:hypothetical protein DIPPA_00172 [Diplonema papillatum]
MPAPKFFAADERCLGGRLLLQQLHRNLAHGLKHTKGQLYTTRTKQDKVVGRLLSESLRRKETLRRRPFAEKVAPTRSDRTQRQAFYHEPPGASKQKRVDHGPPAGYRQRLSNRTRVDTHDDHVVFKALCVRDKESDVDTLFLLSHPPPWACSPSGEGLVRGVSEECEGAKTRLEQQMSTDVRDWRKVERRVQPTSRFYSALSGEGDSGISFASPSTGEESRNWLQSRLTDMTLRYDAVRSRRRARRHLGVGLHAEEEEPRRQPLAPELRQLALAALSKGRLSRPVPTPPLTPAEARIQCRSPPQLRLAPTPPNRPFTAPARTRVEAAPSS